jgi:predicted CopG family antitoxin
VAVTEETKAQEKSGEENRFTSIRLRKDTVEKLKERGRKGESYDDIIKRLLEKRRR